MVAKPGCHLCEAARATVARVAADTGEAWVERDILEDAAMHERYWERIPVLLVDDVQVDYWHVDEQRMRAALARRA
nr:glutaredoxin family protein [Motilibacter deserti]